MHRGIPLLILSLILMISIVVAPCHALFNKDVKKAKEFMQVDMYPQAIELLNKRINEKPTDADAHYLLGECYLHQASFKSADKSLERAVKLESGYGQKIGKSYKDAGDHALQKDRTSQAQNLYQIAVKYQPGIKNDIAKGCFTAGKAYLNRYKSKTADGLLAMAVAYNPSLAGEKDKITKDYGNKLLAIAKDKPKSKRKKYVDEARKYLNQSEIDEVFPAPYWKTVFEKTYTGVGNTGGDDPKHNDGGIETARVGKELYNGDRITVINCDFEMWDKGSWKKQKKAEWILMTHGESGKNITFRAAKGQKFTVLVQRYISSY